MVGFKGHLTTPDAILRPGEYSLFCWFINLKGQRTYGRRSIPVHTLTEERRSSTGFAGGGIKPVSVPTSFKKI
jgi:hypothetical protein